MTRQFLPQRTSAWAAAHGGLRGSTSLAGGALLLAAGALVNLGGQLTTGPGDRQSWPLLLGGWLAWILGLAVTGWGLVWIAAGPVLSRSGWAAGLAHLAAGAALLLLIFSPTAPSLPPWPFAAVRLLLLVLFAWREVAWLGSRTAMLLGSVAAVTALKILFRAAGVLPAPGLPVGPLLDGLLNVAVAVALLQTALRIRRAEARWADAVLAVPQAGLEQFDNPDHADLARR